MEAPIIAIDFDGTIVEHRFPEIGPLKHGADYFIKKLKQSGCRLILWTCRSGYYLDEAVEFCKGLGIEFDAINDNIPELSFRPWPKIYADIYIDDRQGLGFTDWNETYLWIVEKYKLPK